MKDFNRKNLEYPCGYYAKIPEFDSFFTHQHQLEDMKRAGEIGMEAYIREQERKVEILLQLLAEYNDGKRKTFYGLAVGQGIHEESAFLNIKEERSDEKH